MVQRIYENFLGIFGRAEIWVASQPRAPKVIPLMEKGISIWDKIEIEQEWK